MKKGLTVLFIALLMMTMGVCSALGAQDVQISGPDVVVSFPDTFLVVHEGMDEAQLEGSGVTKAQLLNELKEMGFVAQALSSMGNLRMNILSPTRDTLDIPGASEAEKGLLGMNFLRDYKKSGFEVEEYGVVETPYTATLRMKVSLPETGGHFLHYYYSDGRYRFMIVVTATGAAFTPEETELCDAIVRSIHPAGCMDPLISVESYTDERTQMSFGIPVLWHHTQTVEEQGDVIEVFEPYGAEGYADITYGYTDVYALTQEAGKTGFSRAEAVETVFHMNQKEFDCYGVLTMTKAYADPEQAEVYMIERGGRSYAVSQFWIEFEDGGQTYVFPRLIVQHTDMKSAISYYWVYTEWEPLAGSGYLNDFSNLLSTAQYPLVAQTFTPASAVIRRADSPQDFDENGVAEVWMDKGPCGLIAKDGRVLAGMEWGRVDYASDGFYMAEPDYMDKDNDGCRYIHADGEQLGDETWLSLSEFSEGLAAISVVSEKGVRYGYVNHEGKPVIEMKYRKAKSFSEGLAAVWDEQERFIGYIDQKGELKIRSEWDVGYDFREGRACVFSGSVSSVGWPKDGVYGVIDREGCLLGEMIWEDEIEFSEGIAAVCKDKKYGFIDAQGNVIAQPQWDRVQPCSNGLAAVRDENGKYGFIDRTGALAIGYAWDYVEAFSEGSALVFTGSVLPGGRPIQGKYGMINQQGEILIDQCWDNAFNFSEGYAAVERDGLFGLIDRQGQVVMEPQWDDLSSPQEGLLTACKDGKYGYIDLQGNTVLAFEWDEAYVFSNGLARVKKDGCWYYIDRTGNVVI